MKKLMLAVVAAVAVGSALGGVTRNVPTDGDLATVLGAAVSGDEVVIAASDEPYVLTARLTVPAGVTVRGETGDFNDVVVSGGGVCGGFTLGAGAAISNLTVTACVSSINTKGGGILAETAGAVIENCHVTGCWALSRGVYGVGVYLLKGTMRRCLIDGNYSPAGAQDCRAAALYTSGTPADLLVEDTVVTNNWLTYQSLDNAGYIGAAGINGSGRFVRCYVAGNRMHTIRTTGNATGTGFYANGQVTIESCTFEGNTYGQRFCADVSGVSVGSNKSTIMTDTVILGNGCSVDGLRLNNVAVGAACQAANFTQNASDGVSDGAAPYVTVAVTADDFVRVGGMLRPKPGSLASGLGALPDWDGVTPADPLPPAPVTNLVSDISLLQAAIDAAKPGDVIRIAKGNYAVTATIDVKNGVIVEGATGDRDDVILDAAKSCCVAKITGARLRHVTLANGYLASGCGGASVGMDGVLENCRVTGVDFNGGNKISGIVVNNDGGRVIGCLIDNNVARKNCRALAYTQVAGVIERSVIRDNHITTCYLTDGDNACRAAFWLQSGSMCDCIVRDNAIDNVTGVNATITGLGEIGGGEIANCLIFNNTFNGITGENQWGVKVSGGNVVNSIVVGNGYLDSKTKNFQGAARHKNNVTDKATADLCTDSFEGAVEDLFLLAGDDIDIKSGSALVDKGAARVDQEWGVDFYDRPRLAGERIDIGPFEYHEPPFAVTFESPSYSALDRLETTLTATASGDTEGTVYSWFLDDAETPFATGEDKQVVPLVLTELGAHTVTLKAVNGAGLSDEFSQSYKVQRGTFVVNPGESIAAAIAEAEPGATVLLKTGIHTNADVIVVDKAVALRGESREETVITGTGKSRGVWLTANGAVLADLAVADCIGTADRDGGCVGVRLDSGATMTNCVVRNCKGGNSFGAGVYCANGRIDDSVITNNFGGSGTGFYLTGGAALMYRTLVRDNRSGSRGGADGYRPLAAGGVCAAGEIRDSVIAGNVAEVSGFVANWANCTCCASGVIVREGGRLVNCTIVENTHTTPAKTDDYDRDGLIGGVGRVDGTIVNCLIAENYNTSTGGMVRADISVAKDSSKAGYSTTCASPLELMPADAGNISSADGRVHRYSKRRDEYRLSHGSPCAGAGIWKTWMTGALDIYGRAWNPDRVDIGAAVYDCKGLLLMVK